MYENETKEDLEDRILEVFDLAWHYGDIPQAQYKAWIIDRMIWSLMGESDYQIWTAGFEKSTGTKWDKGVSPL